MSRIFHQRISLLPMEDTYIPLFDAKEELDFFQLRMGLDCLCQNALFYPVYQGGQITYQWTQFPYVQEFYYDDCLRYCQQTEENAECDWIRILKKLTEYFCENKPDEYLSGMKEYANRNKQFRWDKFPYDDKCPKEHYIRYRCPYNDDLIKFAFPIYVSGKAVAVIHTGHFTVGNSNGMGVETTIMWKHHFSTEREMDDFIENQLLPIVLDFQNRARRNLGRRQAKMLEDIKNMCIEKMEESMEEFLLQMPERLQHGESQEELGSCFWGIAKDRLQDFLDEIGISELILFLSEEYSQRQKSQRIPGIRLFPNFQRLGVGESMEFEFDFFEIEHILNASHDYGDRHVPENVYYYTTIGTNAVPPPIVQFSRNPTPCDVLAYKEQIQPFAIYIRYANHSTVATYSFSRRQEVLNQLREYFDKVGQELSYFTIRVSDHASKSVLRIYRHEITHQVAILQQNNWFLDYDRLRRMDAAKLSKVAEDQRQCLNELDFMTQNIDVMTGRIYSRVKLMGEAKEINVRSELFNKMKSLYSRKAQEKQIQIEPRYESKSKTLVSKLELLDLIFYNLMSNAIKYGYPGTQIQAKFQDEPGFIWFEKHRISFTNYGNDGDNLSDDIFKMYYRSNTNSQISGSGIGLYVSKTIADLMNATLDWESRKLSDYNIPILARYHQLLRQGKRVPGIDEEAAEKEYAVLEAEELIHTVCNENYLKSSEELSIREIQGEILCPTYEVTFFLKLP